MGKSRKKKVKRKRKDTEDTGKLKKNSKKPRRNSTEQDPQIRALDNLDLPLGVPARATYILLGKLLHDLDNTFTTTTTSTSTTTSTTSTTSSFAVSTRTFKLMSAWFNSVFLLPVMSLQEEGILDTVSTINFQQ